MKYIYECLTESKALFIPFFYLVYVTCGWNAM